MIPLTFASLSALEPDRPQPRALVVGPASGIRVGGTLLRGLADFGVVISRELMTETSAIAAVLSAGPVGRDIDELILQQLPAKRRAAKENAILQRRAREAGAR
jgi:hypothetical protein